MLESSSDGRDPLTRVLGEVVNLVDACSLSSESSSELEDENSSLETIRKRKLSASEEF